ncbi:MAG: acetyl-CoA carboxylase biotin carboxylase subunit, partial [Myxococcota bacterium]|nr:acetyl-CoA carboxylase biotin carboxylase subunit [Myxococcota bacterium]
MFDKILIANRGEIAIRVIRACRELGVATVAVYSDVDRGELHVRLADEACRIGAAPAASSYLDGERLIAAARETGAEAIHPGYGFLSENAAFAHAAEEAGLTWIGPSGDAIARMGDKIEARKAAVEANVPLIPGTEGVVPDVTEARRIADGIGYPLMIKAAGGGGGKGIRIVRGADELDSAFRRAASEAQASFANAAVYIEKYFDRARHVEIQVLADGHGHAIHLGERECSIQRRHQKVIEESPSPVVTPGLRERMGDAAVSLTRLVGYVNAGTVEFLVDEGGEFYFLEMNTRLQVEHPVTELVQGIDLVEWQLRIAAGEPLTIRQEQVGARGWSIEARITAEDTDAGFVPSPGRITALHEPGGPNVRIDSSLFQGKEITLNYDPMVAKLVVWGPDRPTAIRRLGGALDEFVVGGVRTTIPLLARVV